MINRDEALELLKQHIKKKNIFNHSLAVEAVMRALARKLGQDEELWGITGLLHDLDYDQTFDKPELHGKIAVQILDGKLPKESLDAILAHCDKKDRETLIEKAIYPADPITGFIVACALIRKEKTLEGVDLKFMKKRFKEKRFAAGANRDHIRTCEDLGLELDEFLQISLDAMKSIASEIGL